MLFLLLVVEEIVGKHFFEDPETEKDLQNILISSVHQIKTVFLQIFQTLYFLCIHFIFRLVKMILDNSIEND